MNKVILMGRLARDVDMRQTPTGVSVARFTIAVDRNYSKDGQRQADFINCVAWRQTGEFIARYFGKGRMIAVEGSLQTRSWDGQDGNKHYATEVIVDQAYFTGSKAETGGNSQGGGNYGGNSGYGYNNNSNGGYGNNNNNGYGNGGYPAPAQQSAPAAPQQDAFGGFDDGGFMDIDGSEDDLPF
jgi:single-strand DNA-binding protein